MKPRNGYNPKRRVAEPAALHGIDLKEMAATVRYGGNPEHKKSPGDYGLTPPASPRPGKSLCDARGPFPRTEATRMLKWGLAKGMISPCADGLWQQNIWAVAESGEIYEAQLENRETGIYHGYPMPLADRFRQTVREEWKKR